MEKTQVIHYYELHYFFHRKNQGTITIQTGVDIKSCSDEDAFLEYLVFLEAIPQTLSAAIVCINEITEIEYRNMLKK